MEYCLLLAYKCVLFLEKYILLRQNKMLKILRHVPVENNIKNF